MRSFERRICAQTQDLQIFKMYYLSQMNPKEFVHNTAYSVQLPYIMYLMIKCLKPVFVVLLSHFYPKKYSY